MKQTGLLIVLSVVLGYFGPWWVIVPSAFLAAVLFEEKGLKSFIISFVVIFVIWAVYAYYLNMMNEGILATRVSNLIFKSESPILLILTTGLIGGLVSGLAGLSGSLLKKSKKSTYN